MEIADLTEIRAKEKTKNTTVLKSLDCNTSKSCR